MAAAIPIIKGVQGARTTADALTGDLYIKRWQSVKGKGKDKKVVDHELHVNPLTIVAGAAIGAVGVGFAALGAWMLQKRLTTTEGKDIYLILRAYPGKQRVIVTTKRGLPVKTMTSWPNGLQVDSLSNAQRAAGYAPAEIVRSWTGKDQYGDWESKLVRFHSSSKKTHGLGDREGFSVGGLF